MVGDIVHLGAEVQPGGLAEVQREAANEGEVELVVAGAVDVVGSGTRGVAEDEVWGGLKCPNIDELVRGGLSERAVRRVEVCRSDALTPFAIDASLTAEVGIVGGHAGSCWRREGALSGVGWAARRRDGQRGRRGCSPVRRTVGQRHQVLRSARPGPGPDVRDRGRGDRRDLRPGRPVRGHARDVERIGNRGARSEQLVA